MRSLALLGTLLAALAAGAETPAGKLWTELEAKREKLLGAHQEFELTRTFKTGKGDQSSKQQIIIDLSQGQWRERSVSGSGNQIKIFDGEALFSMDEGGAEFVRSKRRSKKEAVPVPAPYNFSDPDWSKAVELERRSCGIPGSNHTCVVLEVPLKKWTRGSPNNFSKLVEGIARMALDTETGLLMSARTAQVISGTRGGYKTDIAYVLKRMGYGAPADPNLFKLPSSDMREVKELSSTNATTIKKGKPAPELVVMDMEGKLITLSALKGKTVLLDFWATWCPPCRADGPALDKLHRRYSEQDLVIVGISVNEERSIVEKFLQSNPHAFPIVLTAENEMPVAYHAARIPTYIVIDRDGTVAAAETGDQGFRELRRLLTKAGLEIE
jgi:thiol-disulfide isomerase/thioredoxin